MEIIKKSSGEPEVQLSGAAALKAKEVKAGQVMVSLTHSKDYAAANAVIIAS
jgi:phosphopantetheinyl transferase (holo-ACP synthase)